MPPARCVALAFDPHRLDRQQRQLLAGIHRYAEHAPHWRCVFDPGAPRHLAGRYHGLLAPGGTHTAPLAARAGVPAIIITWLAFDTPGATRVVANRWMAARMAAEHLHQRGYRSFAYVGTRHYAPSRIEHREFRRWLGLHGLSAQQQRPSLRRLYTSREWGDECDHLRRWLDGLSPPVGIFCSTDALARTLDHLARRAALRVPDDVGIVAGGNDVPLCELEQPTLTSIDYHYETVGRRAAELLDRLMDGEPAPRRNILIPPTLIPRQSTGLGGIGDPLVARALEFIEAHCAEPIRLAHVAQAAGLGERQLQRRMRDHRGRTIVQEILRARLDAARRLLETTDLPLTAIAPQAGFASRRTLTAAFRHHLATTPTAYRQHQRS